MKTQKLSIHFTLTMLMLSCWGFSQALLQGQVWTLTKLLGQNGTSHSITNKNYTLEFKDAGKASILADCNGCGGQYAATASNLLFTMGMCTRKSCGDGSLDLQYINALTSIKNWSSNANTLFLKNASNQVLLTFTNGVLVEPGFGMPKSDFYQDWALERVGLKSHKNPPVKTEYKLKPKMNGNVEYNFDCNSCSGTLTATDSKFKIGVGLCTMMACTDSDTISTILHNTHEKDLEYLIIGNRLFVFINDKSDTLVYHNFQTSRISFNSKFGTKNLLNWSVSAHSGWLQVKFSKEVPRFTLSVFTMLGEKMVTTSGRFQNQSHLQYSFQPGSYLVELLTDGQTYRQKIRIH